MRNLRRIAVLLAGATGLVCATTGAAFALAQGPGYKAGPLIGTVYRMGPRMVHPTPKPPPPPAHMGGMPWHPGLPGHGGHGSAWHVGGMGGAWGTPRPGGFTGHGGGWHVRMGVFGHGTSHFGWMNRPLLPGSGWSAAPSWGGHANPHMGWAGRPPLGVHPLGLHFYGMGGGSLARAYGASGGRFVGGDVWRSTYRIGGGGELAARYGRLEHGFSPLLPPSNWGHGPLKPQLGRYVWQVRSGWSLHGGRTAGPVAWRQRPPSGPAPAPIGWHPPFGWNGHAAWHAWHDRHDAKHHHGVFARLRRELAHDGGRVTVTWARFTYRAAEKHPFVYAAPRRVQAVDRRAWSRPKPTSAGRWTHGGSRAHYAAW